MEKDETKIKRINIKTEYVLIAAGLAFFFNPNVNIIDVLPDALGALLVYAGLDKLGDIDGYFESAKKLSFYMIWLYALKFALSLTVFSNTSNTLPLTFFSSVLEIIILCAFFGLFYSGFEYTLMRKGNGQSVKAVANAKTYTLFFVAAKSVLSFMPEILELFRQKEQFDFSAQAEYSFRISTLKPYVVLFCAVLSLILGVIYLVRTFLFINTVRKDEIYNENLTNELSGIRAENKGKFVKKRINLSCFCFGCAALFSTDAVFEGKDFLPGIICGIALALAVSAFSAYEKSSVKDKIICAFLIVFTSLDTVLLFYLEPLYMRVFSLEETSEINGAQFIKSGLGTALIIAFEIALAALMIVGIKLWTDKCAKLLKDEFGAKYERSLFTIKLVFGASVLIKALRSALNAYITHTAFSDEVSAYLKARSTLTLQSSVEFFENNPKAALFERLDSAYSLIAIVGIVVAVFAAVNVLSFKSRVNGEG